MLNGGVWAVGRCWLCLCGGGGAGSVGIPAHAGRGRAGRSAVPVWFLVVGRAGAPVWVYPARPGAWSGCPLALV
jgi:hypothetical protein